MTSPVYLRVLNSINDTKVKSVNNNTVVRRVKNLALDMRNAFNKPELNQVLTQGGGLHRFLYPSSKKILKRCAK